MTTQTTLGELVATNAAAAEVFHRHRLDFCCGGGRTLAEACAEGGLSAEAVLKEIAAATPAGAGAAPAVRWDERPLGELVQHIVERYHGPLRSELPRLIALARKVEQVHADKPDRPAGLGDLLTEVQESVAQHLAKEEQILFPLILAGRGQLAHMPVQVMMQEHEDHGQNLRRIRALTRDLALPAHACASWRELYRALGELERELMEHIHLENNILFPRALGG